MIHKLSVWWSQLRGYDCSYCSFCEKVTGDLFLRIYPYKGYIYNLACIDCLSRFQSGAEINYELASYWCLKRKQYRWCWKET